MSKTIVCFNCGIDVPRHKAIKVAKGEAYCSDKCLRAYADKRHTEINERMDKLSRKIEDFLTDELKPKHGELTLMASCPKCGVLNILDPNDISSFESECELCGSHGEVSIDFKCKYCNEYINHKLREW